jgi:transcriptional regulator with XRE-family HTH domain
MLSDAKIKCKVLCCFDLKTIDKFCDMFVVRVSATSKAMHMAKDAGKRLAIAREAHGMTATELSRRAGVSRVAIASLEEGRALPRLETVESLARSLEVPPSWIAFGEPLFRNIQAPAFDEVALGEQLEAIANSVGGVVDQKFLYFEIASVAAWMRLESVREFPAWREVADVIAYNSRKGGLLELVSLGSGTALAELRILNCLKERFMLKVVLLDVNRILLQKGESNIKNGIGKQLHSLLAIQGNIEELNCYHEHIRLGLPPARRIVSMLGYTFSNLANEIVFLQNALLGFDPGDYFLLDVALHHLPLPIREDLIRETDPTLQGELFEDFDPRSIEFFSCPILRNRRGIREAKVSRKIQYPTLIPNSYAVSPVVTAYDYDGKHAEFRFSKANRYHLESLVHTIEREGFKHIQIWRYGERVPCAVILFERSGR